MEIDLDSECFCIVTWGQLLNELALLQKNGRIKNLRYRKDTEFKTGCFIARFEITDAFRSINLLNVEDYIPDEDQNKKRWFKW